MKSKTTLLIILFLSAIFIHANDFDLDFPNLLIDPVMPVEPLIPGENNNMDIPRIPGAPLLPSNFIEIPQIPIFPALPGSTEINPNQTREPVRELERLSMEVTGAFPNGDLRRNTASTITNAVYILYSNGEITLEFDFIEGPRYIYHLSNPRARTEIGPGMFRMSYDTSIQIGNQFVMGQFISELFSNADGINSVNIMGNNTTIVILNLTRKT